MATSKQSKVDEPGIQGDQIQSSGEKSENKKSDEDEIVVSRKDLEIFLQRLDSLESENKKLFAVADKGRLYSEQERLAQQAGAPLIHTVRLTRMGSTKAPIVIAWKLIDNDSYTEGSRSVHKQNMEVFSVDGKSQIMRLVDFYRNKNTQTKAEVIKRTKNEETDEIVLTVRLGDGQMMSIPLAFVN